MRNQKKSHLNKPPFLNNQMAMKLPQSLTHLLRRSLLRPPQRLTKSVSRMSRNQQLRKLNIKNPFLSVSLLLVSLLSRMMRKPRMSQRFINLCNWMRRTKDLWQRIRPSVKWSSFRRRKKKRCIWCQKLILAPMVQLAQKRGPMSPIPRRLSPKNQCQIQNI